MNEDEQTTSISENYISSPETNKNVSKFEKLKINKIINFFSRIFKASAQTIKNRISNSINTRTSGRNFGNKNNSRLLFPIIAIVLLASSFYLGRLSGQSSINYHDDRPLPSTTKARQVLNKELEFPLKDNKGNEISKIKYKIETAELQDSIIVKGQRARAVKGRTFLILNLKITNSHTQGIEINSRDYIRLFLNNQKESIAADIHNDPVAIQAISTKFTRLGFPINDSDKNLMLRIGEIKGKKETVKLNFQ